MNNFIKQKLRGFEFLWEELKETNLNSRQTEILSVIQPKIKQALIEQQAEIVKKIHNQKCEEYLESNAYAHNPDASEFENGYNQSRWDIINLISPTVDEKI